jgi:hypothetical protein
LVGSGYGGAMRLQTAIILAGLVAVPAPAAAQAPPPLPPDAVAQVGAEPIPMADFEHWVKLARRGAPVPVDPPGFERCMAGERRRARKQGHSRSRHALELHCRRRERAARSETMSFLVQALWIRQETAARRIVVSPARVRKEFERQKRASFPSERAFRRFMRTSGMNEADLLVRVELNLLQELLTKDVTAEIRPGTTAEARRYLARHRRKYRGQTRRRALRSIRTLITARRQQRALNRFIEDFRPRYRALTVCAHGYEAPECGTSG